MRTIYYNILKIFLRSYGKNEASYNFIFLEHRNQDL